jgi:hypothetical protein
MLVYYCVASWVVLSEVLLTSAGANRPLNEQTTQQLCHAGMLTHCCV